MTLGDSPIYVHRPYIGKYPYIQALYIRVLAVYAVYRLYYGYTACIPVFSLYYRYRLYIGLIPLYTGLYTYVHIQVLAVYTLYVHIPVYTMY